MRYMALLAKWNRTYNLTAIREPAKMVSHHLLDSLAVVPHCRCPPRRARRRGRRRRLAGHPARARAAAWRVTLNDTSQKKVAFLRQAAIELELANVDVHAGRVEAVDAAAEIRRWSSRARSPASVSSGRAARTSSRPAACWRR